MFAWYLKDFFQTTQFYYLPLLCVFFKLAVSHSLLLHLIGRGTEIQNTIYILLNIHCLHFLKVNSKANLLKYLFAKAMGICHGKLYLHPFISSE